jgi:hypothetical protein
MREIDGVSAGPVFDDVLHKEQPRTLLGLASAYYASRQRGEVLPGCSSHTTSCKCIPLLQC